MTTGRLSMAEILEIFTATGQHPLKFTAYDGSTAGQDDATLGLIFDAPRRHLLSYRSRRTRPGPRLCVG